MVETIAENSLIFLAFVFMSVLFVAYSLYGKNTSRRKGKKDSLKKDTLPIKIYDEIPMWIITRLKEASWSTIIGYLLAFGVLVSGVLFEGSPEVIIGIFWWFMFTAGITFIAAKILGGSSSLKMHTCAFLFVFIIYFLGGLIFIMIAPYLTAPENDPGVFRWFIFILLACMAIFTLYTGYLLYHVMKHVHSFTEKRWWRALVIVLVLYTIEIVAFVMRWNTIRGGI